LTRLDNKIDGQLQLGLYAQFRICCTPAWSGMCGHVDFSAGLEAVISRFGPCIREIAAGSTITCRRTSRPGAASAGKI